MGHIERHQLAGHKAKLLEKGRRQHDDRAVSILTQYDFHGLAPIIVEHQPQLASNLCVRQLSL
ncbi:MAG: hypothetical protein KUL86_03290 [Castellaniella sp.]|nr:hypothetical protein [Castellaniella sp.]